MRCCRQRSCCCRGCCAVQRLQRCTHGTLLATQLDASSLCPLPQLWQLMRPRRSCLGDLLHTTLQQERAGKERSARELLQVTGQYGGLKKQTTQSSMSECSASRAEQSKRGAHTGRPVGQRPSRVGGVEHPNLPTPHSPTHQSLTAGLAQTFCGCIHLSDSCRHEPRAAHMVRACNHMMEGCTPGHRAAITMQTNNKALHPKAACSFGDAARARRMLTPQPQPLCLPHS